MGIWRLGSIVLKVPKLHTESWTFGGPIVHTNRVEVNQITQVSV